MNAEQITKHLEPKSRPGEEMAFAIVSACGWLREIAYQLSVLNQDESGGGKMFHFHINGVGREEIHALLTKIDQLAERVELVIEKENHIMATEQQFQAKIDQINANTTASAAAAQIIAKNDTALKTQLDELLTKAGVPADVEAAILAKLDQSASAGEALKTFLEATAAGPVTTPEPPPVPVP